ncbi:unnamed protein product [Caenorhabditis sp. 36 PRJEB53466]|nr:unnamed protein product [Caenorhabditis sp. 36 PRJEB53466]
MFATWLARRLYSQFDADRIFEEMDKIQLETRILEHEDVEEEEDSGAATWILTTSAIVCVGGITVAFQTLEMRTLAGVVAGLTVVGGTVALGATWHLKRKIRAVRNTIAQMEATKMALKRRKQVFFSISMRVPRPRNPLVCRACRLTVTAIEVLNSETLKMADATWQDLYTREIRAITERSRGNAEKLQIEEENGENEGEDVDFETVFETLIAVFKLHASEYCRVLLSTVLEKFEFKQFRTFLIICERLQDISHKLNAIEKAALKGDGQRTKNGEKREKAAGSVPEIGWKQQTEMALEAVLDGLESGHLSRSEVELALRRTLVILGTEPIRTEIPENSGKIDLKLAENAPTQAKMFERTENTDEDMVFEGIPLSEADKLASRSAVARDVLLDGSEGRKHEANLFGELKMVLEPRRTDFAKRERKALAAFYGIDEKELEEKEKEEEESLFEGVGMGESVDAEPYDWRKDAENSAGIHQHTENDTFLSALAARRVHDNVIE